MSYIEMECQHFLKSFAWSLSSTPTSATGPIVVPASVDSPKSQAVKAWLDRLESPGATLQDGQSKSQRALPGIERPEPALESAGDIREQPGVSRRAEPQSARGSIPADSLDSSGSKVEPSSCDGSVDPESFAAEGETTLEDPG